MNPAQKGILLAPNALNNIRIAISASESADLLRLGLAEIHFRLALAEIARSVLVSGGKLSYGGHLDPDGYTAMLIKELQRYSRRDQPIRIYLAWQEHRKLTQAEYNRQTQEVGLLADIICLDPDGNPISFEMDRGAEAILVDDANIRRKALSGLRRQMAKNENGRVLIGGKRTGFQGEMPGILEEALASIEQSQPLYLAGGFGGITTEIAMNIGFVGKNFLPPMPNAPPADKRTTSGLKLLSKYREKYGWPDNGLSDVENARLAATHRPSEIAALVSLGLGRRFSKSPTE